MSYPEGAPRGSVGLLPAAKDGTATLSSLFPGWWREYKRNSKKTHMKRQGVKRGIKKQMKTQVTATPPRDINSQPVLEQG